MSEQRAPSSARELLTPLRVGLVVVLATLAFFWMSIRVREGIGEDPAGYQVYALFDDVGGLAVESRVVIAGITVGEIAKIELAGDKAKVWLKVNVPLKSDARVAKRSAGLLGEYFLQLTPGYLGTPLGEGDLIAFVDKDTEPAELMNEMKTIAENVRDITESVRKVIGDEGGEQKLLAILDNVNGTVAEVRRTVGDNGYKVDRVVDNVVTISDDAKLFVKEFRRDASRVMVDAQAVASNAREVMDNVHQLVGKNSGNVQEGFEGVRGAVSRLQTAMDKLDGTLERAQSIAAKIDDGQGTIGRLVNDDHLIESVGELVDESSHFVKQITRLQTIVALRSEYYVGQASMKNYLSLRLQPRPDKYYLIQVVDDPRGATTFRETVTASSASDQDPVVREQETITEDRFRLSLQFAKRFGPVTGRIGIIENTGGFGADLHLFEDELEISADIFAFDENINPHIKIWGLYTFFTHLYVAVGVDDVWNEELADVFIGGGIRFDDEDLKALLTTAPMPSL